MKHKKEVRKIKAIIFDVGGVLREHLDKTKRSGGVHEHIAKTLGIGVDTWFDSIDIVYADSNTGKASRKDFLKIASRNLGFSEEKIVKTVKKCYAVKFQKNKELFKIAFKLKKEQYIIGILSDQWALSTENIIPKEDRKGFSPVIISSEVGVRKPDPKVYKLLMKKLKEKDKKIKEKEVIFIDNRDWNMTVPKKMGIKTILFKDNKQLIEDLKKLDIIGL